MDYEHIELEEAKRQLALSKLQDMLLEEIEMYLSEMKSIAEYATSNELSAEGSDRLNGRMKEMQKSIQALETRLLLSKQSTILQ
ncbi:hypothetical protein [Sporosarcina sp. A2]|uniref:hypothetical protein n=1 Tax=Sporosarcina sp. A2 TaxID=3393449 RepID=UPI003D7B8481